MSSLARTKEVFLAAAEEINDARSIDNFEMYRVLVQLGDNLPALEPEEKVLSNFVEGCVSNVYIVADFADGRISFRASSDAQVVKGYLAIMVDALSGLTPEELLGEASRCVEQFAVDVDIKSSLTPTRANAFGGIYKLMRRKAQELLAASDSGS